MIRYAQLINEETGLCNIGTGTNIDFYKSIGMTELDVQQSDVDNNWYLIDKCPMKAEKEKELEEKKRVAMLKMTPRDFLLAISMLFFIIVILRTFQPVGRTFSPLGRTLTFKQFIKLCSSNAELATQSLSLSIILDLNL